MANELFTYGANATATAAFFNGFDTIAYSPLDYTSPVTLSLSAAGTVDLTTQLLGRAVTFTAATTGSNTVTTSDGDDTIIGGFDADVLNGGAGSDTIYSGPQGSDDTASDTLIGGSGNDTLVDFGGAMTAISGGSGNDTIRLGGTKTLIGSAVGGTIDGGADTDTIESVAAGSSGLQQLRLQNLTITNVEILDGRVGATATAAQFVSFQSILSYPDGILTLAAAGSVHLDAQLNGRATIFHGSDGDDTIALSSGGDRIEAGDGNDTLIGLGGSDQLYGGAGVDTVDYSSSPGQVEVDLLRHKGGGGDAGYDSYDSIESVIGSDFDDVFVPDAAANALDGRAGIDTVIYYDSPFGVTVNLQTGTGAGGSAEGDTYNSIENIVGSAYGDVLTGDDHDNEIRSTAEYVGNNRTTDIVHGGGGNDTIWVEGLNPQNSQYYGDAGMDTFHVRVEWISLDAIDGSLTVSGGENDDRFFTIDRAWGSLDGGNGNDSLYFEVDDWKGPHGQYALEISNIENLYTRGYTGTFTAEQLEGFDVIAYGPAALSQSVSLIVSSEGGTSVDLSEQLKGRSATVRLGVALVYGRTSDGDDLLYGGMNATYATGAGKDTITGSTGTDTLIGGAGADTMDGGDGTDTASYAGSAQGVQVSLTTGLGHGGDAEGDSLTRIENLIGSSQVDVLTGDAGANRIDGGDGADTLEGRAGADRLIGGTGTDSASYGASTVAVKIDLSLGTGTGGDAEGDTFSSIENVTGSALADTLIGNSAANRLDGGLGDDVLSGRGGADALVGGGGIDTAAYRTSALGVRADLTAGIGTGGDAAGDSYSGIENINGSGYADTLIGNSAANRLDGGLGDDVLSGRGGADMLVGGGGVDTASFATSALGVKVDLTLGTGTGGDAEGDTYSGIGNVVGSNFADTLVGTSGANRLDGGAGDDFFSGGAGADTLIGGTGVDTASYWTSALGVKIDLTLGTASGGDAEGDTLSSIQNINGSTKADTLIGSSMSNRLYGGPGDDVLSGRGGADVLNGGGGIDTAAFGTSTLGVKVDLTLGTGTGGDAEGDTYSGIFNVSGSNMADTLIGNASANRLAGSLGNDTLTGRGGADTFAFTTAPSNSNIDTITDFTVGSDLIELSKSIYSTLKAGTTAGSLAASSFRLSTQTSQSGGLGEIIYSAATGRLSFDSDGAGSAAAKQFAQVSTGLALSASSFRLA